MIKINKADVELIRAWAKDELEVYNAMKLNKQELVEIASDHETNSEEFADSLNYAERYLAYFIENSQYIFDIFPKEQETEITEKSADKILAFLRLELKLNCGPHDGDDEISEKMVDACKGDMESLKDDDSDESLPFDGETRESIKNKLIHLIDVLMCGSEE